MGGVQGHENIIFSDDFESYPIGSFPSQGGWEIVWDGAGREYQKVIVAKEVLGSDEGHGKVLHLLGRRPCSSVVKRSFTTNSRYIGYEFDILILDRGEGYRDHPGFFCEECRTWGAYWATVEFSHKDGKIYAKDGTVLGSWTPGRWYHVKVILDRENDRYDVYIDGQLKGHNLLARGSDDPSSWNIKSLALVSAWPGKPVLYDNVKVFIVEAGSTSTTTTTTMTTRTTGLDVYFSSSIINSRSIDPSNPVIMVAPGERLKGFFEVRVVNNRGGPWITPVIGVASWMRGSVACINPDAPTGESTQRWSFDLTAPSEPGTYYIGIFAGWWYTCDEVASQDHPARYGDGDDVLSLIHI